MRFLTWVVKSKCILLGHPGQALQRAQYLDRRNNTFHLAEEHCRKKKEEDLNNLHIEGSADMSPIRDK